MAFMSVFVLEFVGRSVSKVRIQEMIAFIGIFVL